jgi:DNA (cytosine-5)-methyltransferase 1
LSPQTWPTPRSCSAMAATITPESAWNEKRNPNLETIVGQRMYPTPTAHNAKECASPSEYNRNTPTLATHAGGKLNPTWVEWLMGWPLGHTDLKPLGMGKSHSVQQQPGES